MRKSINLGKGFRINLSKSGIGYSRGVPGYRITKTARGTRRRTYSIPGTGLSYVDESGRNRRNGTANSQNRTKLVSQNVPQENFRNIESAEIGSFKAADIENVTSAIEKTLRMWNCSFQA